MIPANFSVAGLSRSLCLILLLNSSHLTAAIIANASACVAHRGYSAKYLENSVEALLAAEDHGVAGIEFDVVHTKDGVPIVHHDETPRRTAKSKINRSCKLDTPFAEQTFLEMRANCVLHNGEDIPSLAEIFSLMRGSKAQLFVELKDEPSKITLDLLAKNIEGKMIISFEEDYLDQVAEAVPQVPLILATDEPRDLPERFSGIGTQFLSDSQISELHQDGKLANIWTVNDKNVMKDLIRSGIDYITSDEVEICMEQLRNLNDTGLTGL